MNTTKSILVATDFSEISINSVKYSVELALKMQAKLYILHSYHIELPVDDSALFPNTEALVYMQTVEESRKASINEQFKSLDRNLFTSDLPDREFITRQGFVVEVINSIVKEKKIDLVVMAPTGPHLFGTHITLLIDRLDVPMLVIPTNTNFREIKEIVMAADFGGVSENINVLTQFAALDQATVQVLNNETGYEDDEMDFTTTTSAIDQYLKQIPHKFHKSYFEDPEDGILDYIQHHKVDMLVLVPRHHNLFERIFKKSISGDLATRTTVPLLIVPE